MFRPGDIIHSKFRNIEMNEGRHSRAKLGFILMSTDLAAESDFFDIVPKDVAIHVTRLKTDDYTTNDSTRTYNPQLGDFVGSTVNAQYGNSDSIIVLQEIKK